MHLSIDVENFSFLKYNVVSYKGYWIKQQVRLAEWSKAPPDLSSGTRMCAWVRTPHLTSESFLRLSKNKKTCDWKLYLFCCFKKVVYSYSPFSIPNIIHDNTIDDIIIWLIYVQQNDFSTIFDIWC